MVSRELASRQGVEEVLIHTGQHHDQNMSEVFFEQLRIPNPKHHLGISGGPHGQMTGRQLEAIERVLQSEGPDAVLVYGDTNSTLAGALAAAKLHIPLAHVEAGLRSFNRRMPEEINRIVTDHVSDLLLAPSQTAMRHLTAEGLGDSRAAFVGDVMYDAALMLATEAQSESNILARLGLESGNFRLATVPRQENTDDPKRLETIFRAFRALAEDKRLVLPIHPRTRRTIEGLAAGTSMTSGIDVIEPLGVYDIVNLMRGASLILTDSGGMQKEGYFHGTPVVVLRDETEWTELLDIGWAKLAPPASAESVTAIARAMEDTPGSTSERPYGKGDAAGKIADSVLKL
jgi:UDP-GlcNAc3NAcA epimerase